MALSTTSMSSPLHEHEADFASILEHFEKDLRGLRTGRASVGLVETVRVDAYGQSMELKAVASVTTPDAKTIQIEPWDKTVVKEVEKALVVADLGMMPNVAGTVIRLVMPPMTEESRKHLVKMLHQKEEQTKISIRTIREKIKSAVTDQEKKKEISEDEKHRELEKLEKVVAEWNAKVDATTKSKEEEIMTV